MKQVHDLPQLYFSANRRDVTQHDLESLSFMDADAGPVKGETGIEGLRLDFAAGLRLRVPEGNWHVRISDGESEFIFLDQDVSGAVLISMEKFYIAWHIEVYRDEACVFVHDFDVREQPVHFVASNLPLGAGLFLLNAMREFVREYGCRATCSVPGQFQPLVEQYYPELSIRQDIPEEVYAVFYPGTYQEDPFLIPDSARALPWQYVGRTELHLDRTPEAVRFHASGPRRIAEPYVCIGAQASSVYKCWHYPHGWELITAYLQELGYRVICIDRDPVVEANGYTVQIPKGAEDDTGAKPLQERIDLLAYADFFIGMGSGLAWLAHAAGCPVVLISGHNQPWTEFDTPYRIYNPLVCHGCYNDLRVQWYEGICPYHRGTAREMECTKSISPVQVMRAIERLRSDHRGGEAHA